MSYLDPSEAAQPVVLRRSASLPAWAPMTPEEGYSGDVLQYPALAAEGMNSAQSTALRRSVSLPAWAPFTLETYCLDDRSPYSALEVGEIRILRLFPGAFGSSLYASLDIEKLDDRTEYDDYEAISYTWGEYDLTHSIYLTNGTTLAINASLHVALQYLRHPRDIRRLWADAACINQADDAEKSAQVARMYDVYAKAWQVVAWLGESSESDKLAIALLKAAGSIQRLGPIDWSEIGPLLPRSKTCDCCDSSLESADCLWRRLSALHSLLDKPWFYRLWVVQEVHAADFVCFQCGTAQFSWHDIKQCSMINQLRFLDGWGADLSRKQRGLLLLRDWYYSAHGLTRRRRPAFEILVGLKERGCSRAHDRVYAALALMSLDDKYKKALIPNYAISIGRLYVVFTHLLMEEMIRQDDLWQTYHPAIMFRFATTKRRIRHIEDLPTWVPDFQHIYMHREPLNSYYLSSQDGCFLAEASRFCFQALDEDWRKLNVRGRCFAKLTKVHAGCLYPPNYIYQPGVTDTDQANEILALLTWYWGCRQQYEALEGPAGDSPSMKAFLSASWRHPHPLDDMPYLCQYHISFDVFARLVSTTLAKNSIPGMPPSVLQTPEELKRIYKDLRRLRCLDEPYVLAEVICEHGTKLAWVGEAACLGDELCYFTGAPFAFVLRKSVARGCFELVGDAWVSGVEEWQALGISQKDYEAMMPSVESAPHFSPRIERMWTPEHLNAMLSAEPRTGVDRRGLAELRQEKEKSLLAWERDNIGWITLV